MTPGYYDGHASYESCVTLCQTLAGCEAVVYKAAPKRCFVKTAGYLSAAPEADSTSAEMCCIRGDCDCKGGDGGEEGPKGKTIAECTLNGINLPGAQLTPGYYEGYPTIASCVKKCQTTPGCRAIGHKSEAKRCFVKSAAYGAAVADTSGRPTASLELCCLEGTC